MLADELSLSELALFDKGNRTEPQERRVEEEEEEEEDGRGLKAKDTVAVAHANAIFQNFGVWIGVWLLCLV